MTSMRVVVLFLGAGLAGGCATGNGASLTAKFVKQGKPAVDAGGPSLAAGIPLQDHMEMIRHLSARPVMKESAGARAESSDPQLAAALARRRGVSHGREPSAASRTSISGSGFSTRPTPTRTAPCCRSRGSPRRTRCWRGSGGTGGSPGSGSDRHRARFTSIRRRRRRRTRSGRCSTRSASLPRHGGRSHARWRSTPAPAYALNNLCFVELRLGRLAEARCALRGGARRRPAVDRGAKQPGAHVRRVRRCRGRAAGLSRGRRRGRCGLQPRHRPHGRPGVHPGGRSFRGSDRGATRISRRRKPARTKRGCWRSPPPTTESHKC